MKLDHLMQTDVITIKPTSHLLAAACSMRAGRVGSLPVVQDGELVGIITERDLVRAMADSADPIAWRVSDFMTPDPAAVSPDDDTEEVARRMAALGVRHLPVVGDRGRLVGIVCARDIASLEAWPRREEAA